MLWGTKLERQNVLWGAKLGAILTDSSTASDAVNFTQNDCGFFLTRVVVHASVRILLCGSNYSGVMNGQVTPMP